MLHLSQSPLIEMKNKEEEGRDEIDQTDPVSTFLFVLLCQVKGLHVLFSFFFVLLLFKLDIKLTWLVLDFSLLGLLLSLSHISWVYIWVIFCIKNNYFSKILFKYSIHIIIIIIFFF
jgi:hypothetical protein